MTETSHSMLHESLSALVDGESNDLDLQRVLNALEDEHSDSVKEMWVRYHSISATIRGVHHEGSSFDLSASIRDALESEPAHQIKSSRFQTISAGFGKTAVAAAVTFGVIFGVQNFSTGALSQNDAVEGAQVAVSTQAAQGAPASVVNGGAVVPQGFELPPISAQTVSTNSLVDPALAARNRVRPPVVTIPAGNAAISNEAFQSQLDRLMFKHAEQSASSSALGAIPFARVSSFADEDKD